MAEKSYSITPTPVVSAPSVLAPYLDTLTSLFHPIAGPVYNTTARFHGWKESMGLVQPGTVENLTREVSREWRSLHEKMSEIVLEILDKTMCGRKTDRRRDRACTMNQDLHGSALKHIGE